MLCGFLQSGHLTLQSWLINGSPPQNVETQKYLGIIFDNKLQWRAQLINVCRKISYYPYMLSLHQKSLTFDVLKMLSELLIFSRIDYANLCIPVWGLPINKSQVTRLQRLQNRVICVTKHLRKFDPASSPIKLTTNISSDHV